MMIPAQQDALAQRLSFQFEMIREASAIDPVVKLLYFERAIACENLNKFLEHLDKLYDGHNLWVVQAFKEIHDFAFNNLVRVGESEMPIGQFYFRGFFPEGTEIPSCKDEVKKLVKAEIAAITKASPAAFTLKSGRIDEEDIIVPNSYWRALSKLPNASLPFSIRSYLQNNELTLTQLSNLTQQQWKNLSNYQIFQIVIVPENHFSVSNAMHLSDSARQEIVKRFLNNEPFQLPTALWTLKNSLFSFVGKFSGHEENNAPGSPNFNVENRIS